MESGVEYVSTDDVTSVSLDQFQAVLGVYSIWYMAVVGERAGLLASHYRIGGTFGQSRLLSSTRSTETLKQQRSWNMRLSPLQ